MVKPLLRLTFLLAVAGCTSTPEKISGQYGYSMPKQVSICHGYSCSFRTKLTLTSGDGQKFAAMFRGAKTAEAERAAISRAVRYFDQRATQATGVRDLPKGEFAASHVKGQMDCVDESTNTHTLLAYLAERGLLKHHTLLRNDSRGMFVDGRYPHWTAVLRDKAGVKWAVDSWYAQPGGAPDIMPFSRWSAGGFLGGDNLAG
jgi:hypothetical protein